MFRWQMNRRLWHDDAVFQAFVNAMNTFSQVASRALSSGSNPSAEFLEIANSLDNLMQAYEKRHGAIDDPLFFYCFGMVNAEFLNARRGFDELGRTRIAYVVNGFKEALSKHLLHPSLPAELIDGALGTIQDFGNDEDPATSDTTFSINYPVYPGYPPV